MSFGQETFKFQWMLDIVARLPKLSRLTLLSPLQL
jgi:hypothetical protein